MLSSGTTSVSTAGDAAVTLIAQTTPSPTVYTRVVVTNTSQVSGFISLDGGNTWAYLPAGTATIPYTIEIFEMSNSKVLLKRIASGSDVTGVFAHATWVVMSGK